MLSNVPCTAPGSSGGAPEDAWGNLAPREISELLSDPIRIYVFRCKRERADGAYQAADPAKFKA